MEGWGSLTMLIKRQEADKFLKAQMRSKLKSQRELYLHTNEAEGEFDFPKISSIEMKRIKDQIRKDLRKEKIKNVLYYFVSFLIVFSVIVYIYLRKQ